MAEEASEFGGVPGLIQPAPHPVVGREAAMLERMVAPDDDQDSVAAVLADILAGKYPRVPVAKPAEILPLRPDVMLASVVASSTGFRFLGVGNWDLRTVRLKASSSIRMTDAIYGPEKQVTPSVAPIVDLSIGLEPGHWFYQVVMNTNDVTQVWEVDVVA
jgi:hypothetical protein